MSRWLAHSHIIIFCKRLALAGSNGTNGTDSAFGGPSDANWILEEGSSERRGSFPVRIDLLFL